MVILSPRVLALLPDAPVVALGAPQPLSGPWLGLNHRCLSFLCVGLWNLPSPGGPELGQLGQETGPQTPFSC